jgi:tetraacyldisaccharide 4'-kinase
VIRLETPPAWLVPLLGAGEVAYRGAVEARSLLYRSGLLRSEKVDRPVISVGNLTAGGNGKTPLVIHLAERLGRRGLHVAVVSRGYGAPAPPGGVAIVSVRGEARLPSSLSGDEPALIAARTRASVLISPRRTDGARRAIDELRADVILLDDGFQHRAIARDLDLVLFDAAEPFANGRLIPRGPLREPPEALGRADLRIAHRGDISDVVAPAIEGDLSVAVRPRALFLGREELPLEELARKKIGIVAAIARPERFVRTLSRLGAEVVHRSMFPDHDPISSADLERAAAGTRERGGSLLVTTEKDAVRIDRPDRALEVPLYTLSIELVVVEGEERLEAALDRALGGGPPSPG